MCGDTYEKDLVEATLQSIYTYINIYKQREREYRLAAKADKGHFYTNDKDRFTNEADTYRKMIDELEKQKYEIISRNETI
jgi:hypothetical protein